MLCISRKNGEEIIIYPPGSPPIRIVVQGSRAKLCIEAHPSVRIERPEARPRKAA